MASNNYSFKSFSDNDFYSEQNADCYNRRGYIGQTEINHQNIDHEGAGHYEIAMSKINDSRCPIDDGQRERDQSVNGALR